MIAKFIKFKVIAKSYLRNPAKFIKGSNVNNINNVKFSIITVSYNSEKFIKDTFESVFSQTYSHFEYILVDGGSSDNTLKIAGEYKKKYEKSFTIISEKDKGIYDAMNKGINLSTGELICIINSDDWLERDALQNFYEAYVKNSNKYTILVGDTNRVTQKGEILFQVKNSFDKFIKKIDYTMAITHPSICIPLCIYKDLVGFFNISYKYLSDYDIIYKASKNPQIKFEFLDKFVVNMREGGVSDIFHIPIIFKRSYERFLIRKNKQNLFKNILFCCKYFTEETLRQFLKRYFPNSLLLKHKRKTVE